MPPPENVFSCSLLNFGILELLLYKTKVVQGYLCRPTVQVFPSIVAGSGVVVPKIRDCGVIGDLKNMLHLQRLENNGETRDMLLGVILEMSFGTVP